MVVPVQEKQLAETAFRTGINYMFLQNNIGFAETAMKIYCACNCGKQFEKYDSRGRERRYIWGHNVNRKGIKSSEETRRKIREARAKQITTEATKIKMSLAHQGERNHFYGKKHTPETIEKIIDDNLNNPRKYWLGKQRIEMSGEKHPNWKGGVTPLNKRLRYSYNGKKWKKAVLQRDGFKCVICGSGEKLEVDHIKPFSLYPELRFSVSNGRTLCYNCHKDTETYCGRVSKYATS